jgi:exosortase F-associated protein
MNKIFRWIIGILCVLGLVAVRFFEDYLFFDPLQQFYHGLYLNATTAPDFDLWESWLSISLRFFINTALSFLILYVAFRSASVMRFSFWLYGISWVLLSALFCITALDLQPDEFFTVFYIRRFLIQPLFILLLLPAFYYQRSQADSKNGK